MRTFVKIQKLHLSKWDIICYRVANASEVGMFSIFILQISCFQTSYFSIVNDTKLWNCCSNIWKKKTFRRFS